MDEFGFIIIILSIACGSLGLILFFKILGMTDDVKVIKNYLLVSKLTDEEIKVGDIVFHMWANQFFVVTEIPDDNSCVCETINSRPRSKTFRKSDLRLFKA